MGETADLAVCCRYAKRRFLVGIPTPEQSFTEEDVADRDLDRRPAAAIIALIGRFGVDHRMFTAPEAGGKAVDSRSVNRHRNQKLVASVLWRYGDGFTESSLESNT